MPLAEQARSLEQLRLAEGNGADLRRRYLQAAHELLHRYWSEQAAAQGKTVDRPGLLFAGDRTEGGGGGGATRWPSTASRRGRSPWR